MDNIPKTSTTLLRDVADSGHARWAVFYARYRPMMAAYLQERFPSLEGEDIIQDTFVALSKILPNYGYEPEEKGTFHNFLTGVLRNKALHVLERRNRMKTIIERAQDPSVLHPASEHEKEYLDWQKSLFDVALKQLMSDETIQERTKQAFVETAIKGRSIEEVATSFGVTRHAVDCMRSRMVERLRKLVEELKGIC